MRVTREELKDGFWNREFLTLLVLCAAWVGFLVVLDMLSH